VPGRDAGHVRIFAAPGRAPDTPIERSIAETLAATGPLPRQTLVGRVPLVLYRDELARGGWLGDVGILGEAVFAPDVTRALEAARGVLWEIETGGPSAA